MKPRHECRGCKRGSSPKQSPCSGFNEPPARLTERRGCGRSPSGIMRTPRPRTATRRRARPQWRRSRTEGVKRRGQAG
jgi:hypothetical protein